MYFFWHSISNTADDFDNSGSNITNVVYASIAATDDDDDDDDDDEEVGWLW